MIRLTSKAFQEIGVGSFERSKGADAVKSFAHVCTLLESNIVASSSLSGKLLDGDQPSGWSSAHKSYHEERSKGDGSDI